MNSLPKKYRSRPYRLVNEKLSIPIVKRRMEIMIDRGYDVPKYLDFCEFFLLKGFEVFLKEAESTVSKYVTVKKGTKQYLIRFSNHKANYSREERGDCDFFVGKGNFTITTTKDAIIATLRHFERIDGEDKP